MKLIDNYKDILRDIQDNSEVLKNNEKYIRVLKNNLADVLNEEVYSKMATAEGKAQKKAMSINVNFLQKIVNKLSQLYTAIVKREFIGTPEDLELAQFHQKTMHLDAKLQKGTMYYNATKSTLIEVYPDSKYKKLLTRCLPNDRYWLWSSNKVDPSQAEVVIKIIQNVEYKERNRYRNEILYFMYTDTEFLAVDSAGKIHDEYMPDGAINPLGFLPFVHVNKEDDEIMPSPDKDTLSTLLQINSILTDAVVANFYQAFPMIVATDVDLEDSQINRNPNSVTILNTKPGSTNSPTIEVKASALNTDGSVSLSKAILELAMDSMGLKVNSGQASAGVSSVQELIHAADTTEVRKIIANDWAYAEEELWLVIKNYHNWLVRNKLPLLPRKYPKQFFSDDFEVTVDFPLLDTAVQTMNQINNGEDDNGETTEGSDSDT